MSYSGLLLAAGESRRMGALKALLDWQGQPLLDYQVGQLAAAGLDPIVVVLGHEADRLRPLVERPGVRAVLNPAYREGRASSVRAGAAALPDDTQGVLVLAVDQPRPAALLTALIAAHRAGDAAIIRPAREGRHGHPVLFAGHLLPELRAVDEATEGLRAVVRRHAGAILDLPTDDPIVFVDINTPEAYEEAHRLFGYGIRDR